MKDSQNALEEETIAHGGMVSAPCALERQHSNLSCEKLCPKALNQQLMHRARSVSHKHHQNAQFSLRSSSHWYARNVSESKPVLRFMAG